MASIEGLLAALGPVLPPQLVAPPRDFLLLPRTLPATGGTGAGR
jgi:hypothetical protein